jgi:hypothetical protein
MNEQQLKEQAPAILCEFLLKKIRWPNKVAWFINTNYSALTYPIEFIGLSWEFINEVYITIIGINGNVGLGCSLVSSGLEFNDVRQKIDPIVGRLADLRTIDLDDLVKLTKFGSARLQFKIFLSNKELWYNIFLGVEQ